MTTNVFEPLASTAGVNLPELSETDAIAGTGTTASSITAAVLNAAIADRIPGEMAEADAIAGTDTDPLLISAATLQAKIDDAEPPELAEAVAIVGTDETPSLISAETLHSAITAHVSANHELDDLFHAPKPDVADAGKVQTVSPTGTVIWDDLPVDALLTDAQAQSATDTTEGNLSGAVLNAAIDVHIDNHLGDRAVHAPAAVAADAGKFVRVHANGELILQDIATGKPLRGAYDPTADTFDAAFVAPIVEAGEYFLVVADGTADTPFIGTQLFNGDEFVSLVDDPSATSAADWYVRRRPIGSIELAESDVTDETSQLFGLVSGQRLAAIAPRVADDADIIAGTNSETSTFTPEQINREVVNLIQSTALTNWSSTFAMYGDGTGTIGAVRLVAHNGTIYRATTGDVAAGVDPSTDDGSSWLPLTPETQWQFAKATGTDRLIAATAGEPTEAEVTTWADNFTPEIRSQHIYYTGTNTATDDATYVWYIDSAGLVKTILSPAAPAFDPSGLIAYAAAGNITTAMQTPHPTGQTFIQYVFAREGNAIDISIGGNVTGAMLKAEIPAANANVIQRISKRRAGAVDRLIADTELIGLGVYRIWRVGDLLICLVLESTELTDEIGALRQALGSIPAYLAGEAVQPDYVRAMNIRGITTYMRCQIAHTCGATLDVAELNNWRYIGQNRTATAFPASTAVPEGWKYTNANQTYEARSNRLCGTTWNSWAEQSTWNGTALTVFRDLQSNERIYASEIRTTALHGSFVALMATALVDYESPFDLGDAESFNVIQQNQPYPAWAPNLPYPVGFKAMQGGQVRERIAAGTSGTTYDIAENTQWFTEDEPSQIIYHTGTPGNPDITTETAIALNTTTNAITHRWNPATNAWVTMATSSTSGTQINRTANISSAIADTTVTIGGLQVRYNTNGTGGNLEVRGATGSGSLTYIGTRNTTATPANSGTSTLFNGPAGTYTALGAGGLALNSYIRYVIILLDTFYEVIIANRADQIIHISATQYAQSPVVAALPAPAPTPVTATLTAGTFASTGTNTRQFQENGGSGTIVVPAGRVLDGLTATNGVTVQFTATGGFSAIVPANVLAFSLTPTFIPDVAAARTVALTVTSPETSAFPTNNINGAATYNFRVGDTVEVTLGPPHPLGRITSVTVPGGTVEILNARSGRVRITGVTAAGVITVRAAWASFLISGATVTPNRVEAFQPSTVQIEVPANNNLTGLTTTNGTVSGISANGLVTVTPDGNGDLVFTPTFTPIPAKATASHVANAGTALSCGSIRLSMNTAANRGLRIQSNTGANLTWRSMSNWEGGGSPMNTGTATTNGWTQISDFNFSAVSQFQNSIIWDETNNRKYLVFYTVQASFNNSPMMITEL